MPQTWSEATGHSGEAADDSLFAAIPYDETDERKTRRKGAPVLDVDRPIGLFSSLKVELSALIVLATAIAFVMAWFLLKFGWSVWLAMPLTLVVALGITYLFSRGLTAPLRQMRDAAEAMAEGDYTVRVHTGTASNDEVGQLARAFNEMAEELQYSDRMRRDMVANVSHELRTPVSALQAMLENLADGVVEPTPANLEAILNQTHLADGSRCRQSGDRGIQLRAVHRRHRQATGNRGCRTCP